MPTVCYDQVPSQSTPESPINQPKRSDAEILFWIISHGLLFVFCGMLLAGVILRHNLHNVRTDAIIGLIVLTHIALCWSLFHNIKR